MEVNIDQTKWWQRVWAAFIFFTRLPFWRIYKPPQTCYQSVVEHWPLTGWLTGGTMACTIYFGSMVLPWGLTVMVAMLLRVLMTGALHEDGLADFCDGFGGGGSRERILAIMKDSHIGTYGVLGLLFHVGLMWFCLSSLPPLYAALAVLAGDAYSKMVSAQIVMFLPYARTADTAKNGTVYRKISPVNGMILFAEGVLPLLPLLYVGCWVDGVLRWDLLIFLPCLMMFFLYRLMYRKIGGYTGDCCGALFLLVELSFYFVMCLM